MKAEFTGLEAGAEFQAKRAVRCHCPRDARSSVCRSGYRRWRGCADRHADRAPMSRFTPTAGPLPAPVVARQKGASTMKAPAAKLDKSADVTAEAWAR